jgi:(p)ppGpp synthase/HD superfamily hydrolase
LKFEGTKHFFKSIAQGKLDLDDVLATTKEKEKKEKVSVLEFDSFASSARSTAGGILVDGKIDGIMYSYAKCCNPIPGDAVIGFVTIGEGVKVHRKSCNNLAMIHEKNESKFITVQWPENESSLFVAGLKIVGKDSPGILNDISHAIVSYQNTNIKSVNISTGDSSFDGSVTLYVHNISHLERIIERLKKIKGVSTVERFESF